MSKQLAISSGVLLNLSANPFCWRVSGIVLSYRMPASLQYNLRCSERNFITLICLSFLGVPTLKSNFFKRATASLFALSKSSSPIFVYWSANTMHNRNPDSEFTLKSPITGVNTSLAFLLLGSLSIMILAVCDQGQSTHIVYIMRFPFSRVKLCSQSVHLEKDRRFEE